MPKGAVFRKIRYNGNMNYLRRLYRWLFRQDDNEWKKDLIIIAFVMIFMTVFVLYQPNLPTKEELTEWTARIGNIGAMAAIGIVTAETVIAPLPGTIIPMAVGALYGLWPGALYGWIGNVLGSIIIFYLMHQFGRKLAKRIVRDSFIRKYDAFFRRNRFMLWIIYMIPVFPLDGINFVVGLSDISWKRFLTIISVGFAVNIIALTYVGDKFIRADTVERIMYMVGIFALILSAIFVEKYISKKYVK